MSANYNKVCICEYDGTNYSGWQYQDNAITVQEVIEKVLEKLYGEKIRILGSGRTDAGVHALGQVFHYKTEIERSNHAIISSLNNELPKDIVIRKVFDAPENFHPIQDASSKTYIYKILNREARGAIDYHRVWHRREFIDDVDLLAVLEPLIGKHDFTSFCVAKSVKEDCTRVINFIGVSRKDDILTVRINADGFLHNMMRIIVGTAVNIVTSGGTYKDMKNILNKKSRKFAAMTAAPQGLYLEKVYYDEHRFLWEYE